MKYHLFSIVLALLGIGYQASSAAEPYVVTEDGQQISLSTPELEAKVQKKGYVTGIRAQTFVDKKTGFKDAGYGLDIVDWIMEPGSDEKYREQLPKEMVYQFGNEYHGKGEKRSIEGPQICTQAKELSPIVIKGKDFVAIRQSYKYKTAAPGKKTGSIWTQHLVFPAGKRYFVSSDRIDAVNDSPAMFLRVDMPGTSSTRTETRSAKSISPTLATEPTSPPRISSRTSPRTRNTITAATVWKKRALSSPAASSGAIGCGTRRPARRARGCSA